jgi:hypothetical protein
MDLYGALITQTGFWMQINSLFSDFAPFRDGNIIKGSPVERGAGTFYRFRGNSLQRHPQGKRDAHSMRDEGC